MLSKDKMRCPNCGTEMNHHAEKLDLTALLSEREAIDPDLDGIVKEIHLCPACGRSESRRAN